MSRPKNPGRKITESRKALHHSLVEYYEYYEFVIFKNDQLRLTLRFIICRSSQDVSKPLFLNVDFSWILTRIVRVRGEHADHWSTNRAQSKPFLKQFWTGDSRPLPIFNMGRPQPLFHLFSSLSNFLSSISTLIWNKAL